MESLREAEFQLQEAMRKMAKRRKTLEGLEIDAVYSSTLHGNAFN
jgi:hypothetical protein